MFALSPALQLLLMMFAGWVNRHQLRIIEYLKEEMPVTPLGVVVANALPERALFAMVMGVGRCAS